MSDSSLARVAGVLFSPATVFEALRQRPTWLVALLVLVVLGTVTGYLIGEKLDWEEVARQQLEQTGRQLSEDQIEQSIAITEKIGPFTVLAGPLLIGPIAYLVMALAFWAILKMLGGELSYAASFATSLHGLMPNAIAALLTMVVVLGRGELDLVEAQTGSILASNLAVFAPDDAGPVLLTLLASIDLFSIWTVCLLALGYSIVGKVSKAKAGVVVGLLWIVYILFRTGTAALSS